MKTIIKNQIRNFAKREGIHILFAVENGARNWGLESDDSDHDIRFVFYRNASDYLSLNSPPKTYEWKAMGATTYQTTLDYQGFDVYKFINLLAKSNPNLIEWLRSSIVYIDGETADEEELVRRMRYVAEEMFNPVALFYHYRSMGKNNFFKYIEADKPYHTTPKRYLYSFRGLFNALYLHSMDRVPSLDFNKDLLSQDFLPEFVLDFVKYFCVPEKRQGNGNVPTERRREIDEWLYTMFELTKLITFDRHKSANPVIKSYLKHPLLDVLL